MGLAALQSRLILLTSKKMDLESEMTHFSTLLRDNLQKASDAAEACNKGMNATKLVFQNIDGNNSSLTLNNLKSNGYTLTDAFGRIIVPKGSLDDQINYLPSGSNIVQKVPTDDYKEIKTFNKESVNKEFNVPKKVEKEYFDRVQKYNPKTEDIGGNEANSKPEEKKSYIGETKNGANSFAINGQLPNYNTLINALNNPEESEIYVELLQEDGTYKLLENDETSPNNIKSSIQGFLSSASNSNVAFRYAVPGYSDSMSKARAQSNINGGAVTHIFNAEQFVRALLDGCSVENGKVTSNSNMILMQNIDFNELSEKSNGENKTKLQTIIEEYSNKDKFNEGILKDFLEKYTQGDADQKYNMNATNFLSVDNFKGSIIGQGFKMSNVNIAGNDDYSAMFKEIDEKGLVNDVFIDNANVINLGGETNKSIPSLKSSILTQVNSGNLHNIRAKGAQGTFDGSSISLSNSSSSSDILNWSKKIEATKASWYKENDYNVNANVGWGIVQIERRNQQEALGDGNTKKVENDVHSGWDYWSTTGFYNDTKGQGYLKKNTYDNNYRCLTIDESPENQYVQRSKTPINGVSSNISNNDYAKNFTNKRPNVATDVKFQEYSVAYLEACVQFYNNGTNPFRFYTLVDPSEEDNNVLDDVNDNVSFDEDEVRFGWDQNLPEGFEVIEGSELSDGTVQYSYTVLEDNPEYIDAMEQVSNYQQMGCIVYETSNNQDYKVNIVGKAVSDKDKDDLEKYQENSYDYEVLDTGPNIIIKERQYRQTIDNNKISVVDNVDAELESNLRNGFWTVKKYNEDTSGFENMSLADINVVEVADEQAREKAEKEYDITKSKLQQENDYLNLRMKEVETEHTATSTEIESVKKLLEKAQDNMAFEA